MDLYREWMGSQADSLRCDSIKKIVVQQIIFIWVINVDKVGEGKAYSQYFYRLICINTSLALLHRQTYYIMSVLEALGIAGFRSYSPLELEKIEFETPLTLIWGKNGSGKTTIIEVLKYITTGALPPTCDKGKNFVMDPKMIGQTEIIGDTRLKFKAFNGRPVLAKRRALLTLTSKGNKFESIEQTLKTKDEKGEMFEINHHCAQIEKQIPQLLGISKSVLENIVFCHQDQSLWPFSDSANLKAIFDEMFETKKYTKIIQAFWQQHKEYIKEIKENKKALEYLKRLYDEDNRKKRQAMREMEKIGEQSLICVEMREKMEKVQGEIDFSDKGMGQRKFELIMKRGSIEQKISSNTKVNQQLKATIKTLTQQFANSFEGNIRPQSSTQALSKQISELAKKKEDLQRQLEQSNNANILTQKQMEIIGEIRRAKEYLPEIGLQDPEETVLATLQRKCQNLQKKKNELNTLKQKQSKITLPNLLDLPFTEAQYNKQKQTLQSDNKKLLTIKDEILSLYASLYKKVTPSSKQIKQFDTNIEDKLKEVQVRINMKKEELQKYKSMPSVESIKLQKFKIQYTGIDFQQSMYCFCCQKKKCFACSKPLSEAELKQMRAKFDKTKKKAEQKIRELEQQSATQQQMTIDPQQMVSMLTKQIEKASILQKKLSADYRQYSIHRQQIEQNKTNDRLTNGLRKVGLEKQASGALPIDSPTIELFLEKINQYENLKIRLEPKAKEISAYEERIKKNKQIALLRRNAQNEQQSFKSKISAYQSQIRNYDIIQNIYKRLNGMTRQKAKSSRNKRQPFAQVNPQDIEGEIAHITRSIKCLTLQKDYSDAVTRHKALQSEIQTLIDQFKSIDRQLRSIDQTLEEQNKRQASYNQMKVQYVSKKREVDLKAEIAFQEYHKSTQKQYLLKKMQLSTKEAAAKDIQNFCKALENSISKFHRQKMDQVNKYLAEIWRDIYHGQDISLIEIQATFEEDSKRKKSYNYSIVMEKAVSGNKKMEMKGRCSMGQKVLASIVIRLALAEVFASSARILALDEPTTNLDREHIVNLAKQLGRLLELNQCKYLQMIIISHDIEFIKLLEKYTQNYYEVSRNEQRFSTITKRNIRQIFIQR